MANKTVTLGNYRKWRQARTYCMYRTIDGHSVAQTRTHRTIYPCNELLERTAQHRNQRALYIYVCERVTMEPKEGHHCSFLPGWHLASSLWRLPDNPRRAPPPNIQQMQSGIARVSMVSFVANTTQRTRFHLSGVW